MRIVGKKAMFPPLGLITVAALCPSDWSIRLLDQSVEELQDSDILWADLVMVSAMDVQREGVSDVLQHARRLGKRTIIGGPYASSQPEELLDWADHVVVGEPDEVFDRIASDLEGGTAQKLYQIHEKPDITKTPTPRFDLLKFESYLGMSVQFSRGCPFQCEFCDIITIYGRKPRTKTPEQMVSELEALHHLGRGQAVFLVDDNFIGNRKRALDMLGPLRSWQEAHHYPFVFLTEASINLAQCPDLLDAMVAANFINVFIGIETPSKESLTETKKFQNLREDLHGSVQHIQSQGLWVMGGFIIGFDSDGEDVFEQQVQFITTAAIPCAMIGFLQAPPTTPLYDRMMKEGRLISGAKMTDSFSLPNFQTKLPLVVLARGYRETLAALYDPTAYYDRVFQSLRRWHVMPCQKPSDFSFQAAAIMLRSMWYQGICSSYRAPYWKCLGRLLGHWALKPTKISMGVRLLIAGHHFISYAAEVVSTMDREIRRMESEQHAVEAVANR
jgi:radical SAM superfamily enzyme YgiQ (UPF0313 family)